MSVKVKKMETTILDSGFRVTQKLEAPLNAVLGFIGVISDFRSRMRHNMGARN